MADETKLTAATRLEKLLDNIAGGDNEVTPATRLEKFLSYIADAMEGGGGSGGGLPAIVEGDEGKVLMINNQGQAQWAYPMYEIKDIPESEFQPGGAFDGLLVDGNPAVSGRYIDGPSFIPPGTPLYYVLEQDDTTVYEAPVESGYYGDMYVLNVVSGAYVNYYLNDGDDAKFSYNNYLIQLAFGGIT